MGWLYPYGATKESLVAKLTEPYEFDTDGITDAPLASCVRGSNLWAVRERHYSDGTPPYRYIALYLLRRDPDSGDWGYKDLVEESGPYESNCPLSYLDMVPEPAGEWAAGFRERVRAYHSALAAKRAGLPKGKVEIGRSYRLINANPDFNGKTVTVTAYRGGRGRRYAGVVDDVGAVSVARSCIGEEVA